MLLKVHLRSVGSSSFSICPQVSERRVIEYCSPAQLPHDSRIRPRSDLHSPLTCTHTLQVIIQLPWHLSFATFYISDMNTSDNFSCNAITPHQAFRWDQTLDFFVPLDQKVQGVIVRSIIFYILCVRRMWIQTNLLKNGIK